jgi:hypothetical protein
MKPQLLMIGIWAAIVIVVFARIHILGNKEASMPNGNGKCKHESGTHIFNANEQCQWCKVNKSDVEVREALEKCARLLHSLQVDDCWDIRLTMDEREILASYEKEALTVLEERLSSPATGGTHVADETDVARKD